MTLNARSALVTPILIAAFLVASISVHARAAFPTIAELETAFHLYKDSQLPRDIQAADGTIFHSYYVRGQDLGNGEYAVIVRLGR